MNGIFGSLLSIRGAAQRIAHARTLGTPLALAGIVLLLAACTQQRAVNDEAEVKGATQALYTYFEAYAAQNRDALRPLVTDDFELIENGYPMNFARLTEIMDASKPGTDRYVLDELHVNVYGDIALYRYRLAWYEGDKHNFSGIETGHARRVNGRWLLARFHGTWLPIRVPITQDQAAEYAGTYGTAPDGYIIDADHAAIYAQRIDGKSWAADPRRIELIPVKPDEFVVEFDESPARFERDSHGHVIAVNLPSMKGNEVTRFPKTQ